MMRLSIALLALLSFSVSAQSLDGFNKRFRLVKDLEGNLVTVHDNSLSFKFSLKPYLKFIKSHLLSEQARLQSKGIEAYQAELDQLFEGELWDRGDTNSTTRLILTDSMKALNDVDVDGVFKDEAFKEVMKAFEGRIQEAMRFLDPTVVARVDDPKFFWKKTATHQALVFAIDFARKRLSSVPMLNTALFVLKESERLIRASRTYHQNMLLYYVEEFKAADLGMTHEESNMVFSSIHEARIPWYAIWESNAAAADWSKYGVNKFYASVRSANSRLDKHESKYDKIGDRVNYAFQYASYKGDVVVLNKFNGTHMFDGKPAISLNLDRPSKVMRQRIVLQLANLGLSFVPLPSFIKDLAHNFVKSFYEQQSLTEGAMYATFESEGDPRAAKAMAQQALNPFDSVFN
tara:strand:+ start:6107 stop:7318 length:1212 start_codon:yes stop_codon:yes gene_type:complete